MLAKYVFYSLSKLDRASFCYYTVQYPKTINYDILIMWT